MPGSTASPAPDSSRDLALKVLGAGAAGVGTLGLITGVGGAIMFERFSQAGLPAEQAVAVQPKTVLLAVGAEALIPLATTMLLVVAVYWILAKRVSTGLFAVAAGAGAVLYYLLVVSFSLNFHVLVPVLIATAVVCGLWTLLAAQTSSIGARALILALATALLGCAIGLIRTVDAPKVRGAVVMLKNPPKVVAGIYVAETGEQIYLGQVELADSYDEAPKAGSGAIIELSRKDISTVVLASNQGLPTALRQAGLMATALTEEPDGTSVAARLAETRQQTLVAPATSPAVPHHVTSTKQATTNPLRPSERINESATRQAPRHQPSEAIAPQATEPHLRSEEIVEPSTSPSR